MTKKETDGQGANMESPAVAQLLLALGRVEGMMMTLKDRVDALENEKVVKPYRRNEEDRQGDPEIVLAGLTPRQHATLQMVMNGRSTQEMAKRLGVTESTVKVHVRLIGKKCGVKLRRQIAMFLRPAFEKMPARKYLAMSGGLPKDWDETWGQGGEAFDYIVRQEP